MTETFCTSGAVKLKAGANRPNDDTVLIDTDYTALINQAENFFNGVMRLDLVASYGTLPDDKKKILEDGASSHAAMAVINYDMGGYTSRAEAQTMLDVNNNRVTEAIKLLKEKAVTDFIQGT